MRLLPLLVALLLLPLSGLTAGFSAEAPPTTDRWIVITDSSEEGLQVETVTRTLDPLAAQPAHDEAEFANSCGGLAPVVTACAKRFQDPATDLEHGFALPFCTEAKLGGCFNGTMESRILGPEATRTLSCDVLWAGAVTNEVHHRDGQVPADLEPVTEASYEISCQTDGEWPFIQPWGQFCDTYHPAPLEGPGGVGQWRCFSDGHFDHS